MDGLVAHAAVQFVPRYQEAEWISERWPSRSLLLTLLQGGTGVLGQWVEDGRDRNVTCPGVSADLGKWFHQY